MLQKFTLLLVLLTAFQARAQTTGCPDTRATNYSPAATVNDGSCQYATTATTLTTRATLPADIAETSALQYTSQQLWTLNDSGNSPLLYKLDPATGNITQRVRIGNFPNVDWEDLAADAQYLYIGDFGNNNGDRTDLRILRVRKADINSAALDTVDAQAIQFSYPDQTTFTPGTNNHNFDCEALFYANDSLHLFTKNWADRQTKYYTVPATPGTHVARLKARFNVNGLITAASVNPTGTEACLLGYNNSNGSTFLWLLSDFTGTKFFAGNKRRIELPNAIQIGQAEGVTFIDRYRLYLSNERITNIITIPQRLYELNTSPWLATPMATATSAPLESAQVFPNPARQSVTVQRAAGVTGSVEVSLQNMQGQTLLSTAIQPTQMAQTINLVPYPAGSYVLRIKSSAGTFSRKIVNQ
ncbi:T9SS type A sorting domain-containing protein [Hymenobacter norwichensis]|uniref:T9SS type A sorting domain-containing protein n=1 Tax=Hymenobacter norwichensis TaxID=223903 RepID=UPI0003B6356F|nr:T9SS type A sorting domain-containing protein [Hymenobacter norwichensis]